MRSPKYKDIPVTDVPDRGAEQCFVVGEFPPFPPVATQEIAGHPAEVFMARSTQGRAREAGGIIHPLRRSCDCGAASTDRLTSAYLRMSPTFHFGFG